jgi:hypothetical protein
MLITIPIVSRISSGEKCAASASCRAAESSAKVGQHVDHRSGDAGVACRGSPVV